jgi:peptide/nickel transport system substrate-binding protein
LSEKHYCSKDRLVSTLLIGALLAVLLISSLMPLDTFSTQPPLVNTYYKGTIGQPARLDPARAYDDASGELLQNVYQTLIFWNDKHPISFTPGVGYNLTVADYADLDSYEPVPAQRFPAWRTDV